MAEEEDLNLDTDLVTGAGIRKQAEANIRAFEETKKRAKQAREQAIDDLQNKNLPFGNFEEGVPQSTANTEEKPHPMTPPRPTGVYRKQ